MRRALVVVACALSLLLVPVAGGYGSPHAGTGTQGQAAGESATLDDRLAAVARQAPGFGGAFVDAASDTLFVYVADQGRSAALAEGAFRALFLPDDLPAETKILRADYTFLELKAWLDRMVGVLGISGVVFTDIDDRRNRLSVGVESVYAIPAVEAELARNSVPREAVLIDVTEPVTYENSLQDRHRPLVNGLQISFFAGGQFLCTLGWVAVRQGVSGYVTNSHCTAVQGGVENTQHNQPISGAGNRIGQETVDPVYFTGGACPPARRCRYSDSSFGRLDTGVTGNQGEIAKANMGNPGWPGGVFKATSEADAVVGNPVRKVGRTTGQTTGTVQQVCTNFNVSGTNITQLCQSRGSYLSMGGDSGSPVFSVMRRSKVRARGIHWGSGGVYSPISGIQRAGELGPISNCSSGGC
jgi:hypothetical protein